MKHQTRIILASTFGSLIESFDMSLCELLSVYIALYLIGNASQGLFLVFLTFLAGYLARPLGAAAMGILSDIYGRKIILAGSVLTMGISTTLIAFVPSQSVIGILSLTALLILRIIQSFSCGAEYLNSSAYLVENAETSKKGSTGSWASFGTMSGMLIASLLALVVYHFSSRYPDYSWLIWRIPFVFALLGSSIGLYIRLCIPESMEYIIYYADRPKPKFKDLLVESVIYIKTNKRQVIYSFLLSSLGVTTTFQIFIYGPMQAHLFGNLNDNQIITSNIISLIVLLSVFPLIGKLSDKIKREKIVICASMGFFALSQPFFYSLSYPSIYEFIFWQSLIAIPAAAYYVTAPVILSEMFPIKLRCTVLSLLYSIAASLSAGLAPLISFLLVKKTGLASSPSILIFILVIGLLITMNMEYFNYRKKQSQYSV